MIKFTIINILGQLNGILDLKSECYKTLKNIQTVGKDFLMIAWKCMKMVPII